MSDMIIGRKYGAGAGGGAAVDRLNLHYSPAQQDNLAAGDDDGTNRTQNTASPIADSERNSNTEANKIHQKMIASAVRQVVKDEQNDAVIDNVVARPGKDLGQLDQMDLSNGKVDPTSLNDKIETR